MQLQLASIQAHPVFELLGIPASYDAVELHVNHLTCAGSYSNMGRTDFKVFGDVRGIVDLRMPALVLSVAVLAVNTGEHRNPTVCLLTSKH